MHHHDVVDVVIGTFYAIVKFLQATGGFFIWDGINPRHEGS